jgi:hypothetical protein
MVYIRRDTKNSGRQKPRQDKESGKSYLSIAHNVREETEGGSRTKPIVLANLGPEDEISGELASSIAKAFERYAAKRLGSKPQAEDVKKLAAQTRVSSPVVRILASKELGMRMLLSVPWRALGIGDALSDFEKRHPRIEFPLERIVFALVLNRLVDPKSKLACNHWIASRGFMPEAKGWQVQHLYRALDILHEHWEELEELLASHLDALLSDDERRLQLVDTTSIYFESEMTDREIALLNEKWDDFEADGTLREPRRPRPQKPNEEEFRMRGHNKDGHPESPQVKLALMCSPGGVILRHRVYAGNVGDTSITRDLLQTLPKPDASTPRIWVADAGMMGKEQIAALDKGGWDRVTAEPLRKSNLGQHLFKAQGGQYRKDRARPHMSYKVENVSAEDSPSGRPERWVFTRNERERERQMETIERHLDAISAELGRKPGKHMAHAKSVCAVASHVSYRKYIKPSENVPGEYRFDQEAIAWERRLAGVRLYRTTLTDLDGPEILNMYTALQDVEAMNKTLKHPLRLRPCYHRTERRIRAHVMINVLAANCALYLERHTGLTLEKLRKLASDVQAHEMLQGSKRYWQRNEVAPEFEKTVKTLGIELPPLVWSSWIEPASKPKTMQRRPSQGKQSNATVE